MHFIFSTQEVSHKQPVIIIKMRANMRSPEYVPHVKPYLKTQKTDTSFAQNNIKSGSPGMCFHHMPKI